MNNRGAVVDIFEVICTVQLIINFFFIQAVVILCLNYPKKIFQTWWCSVSHALCLTNFGCGVGNRRYPSTSPLVILDRTLQTAYSKTQYSNIRVYSSKTIEQFVNTVNCACFVRIPCNHHSQTCRLCLLPQAPSQQYQIKFYMRKRDLKIPRTFRRS